LFLIVATVAEQILELFRGTLERFGLTLLKGGLTLEQAQKIALEALPPEGVALAKVNALVAMGDQFKSTLSTKQAAISDLRQTVADALGEDFKGTIEAGTNSALTALTTEVRMLVEASESSRIFALRLLSCAVCCILCLTADFNAFDIAFDSVKSAGATGAAQSVQAGVGPKLLDSWIGHILTGFASASGSSYWHDALDKIRAAKTSISQLKTVATI
jgi:hypothetical protein